ncbi:MAG: MFS transporter [Desulfovibrionaceae bacterium]|nr:MFS transporter [Desulfovibrionaceae bacterium]
MMQFRKILLMSLGHLACDINGNALPALLPYLAAAYQFDYRTCGTLAFAYAVVSSVIQPVFGLFADRVRRSWFIPLGIILAGCSLGIVGYLDTYWTILLAFIFCGIGSAIFHPEGARAANQVSGDHKGTGLSIFSIGGNSGLVVGPFIILLFVGGIPLGSFTLGGFGLRGTAAFGVISTLVALYLYSQIAEWNLTPRRNSQKTADATLPDNNWQAFSILSVCVITRAILFFGFNMYVPMYWHHVFHSTEQTANLVLIVFCGVGLLSNLIGGIIADRFGYVSIIRWTFWLSLPFVAVFPLITDPTLAFILMLPIAFVIFAPFSSMVVLGQKYLARNMGFASGITLGVGMSIGGTFTPIIGWVADNYGGLPVALHILTVFTFLGAIAAMRLKKYA